MKIFKVVVNHCFPVQFPNTNWISFYFIENNINYPTNNNTRDRKNCYKFSLGSYCYMDSNY